MNTERPYDIIPEEELKKLPARKQRQYMPVTTAALAMTFMERELLAEREKAARHAGHTSVYGFTVHDVERIEKARLKRERKAQKKS